MMQSNISMTAGAAAAAAAAAASAADNIEATLDEMWVKSMKDILNIDPVQENWKIQALPLARIKKIMKSEEFVLQELEKDRLLQQQLLGGGSLVQGSEAAVVNTETVSTTTVDTDNSVTNENDESAANKPSSTTSSNIKFMISSEAPLLMTKACELFIQEISLRAWKHTDRNRRRTLQRADIHSAVGESETFDFLIDIVPRVLSSNPPTSATATTAPSAIPQPAAPTIGLDQFQQQQAQHLQQQQQIPTSMHTVNQNNPSAAVTMMMMPSSTSVPVGTSIPTSMTTTSTNANPTDLFQQQFTPVTTTQPPPPSSTHIISATTTQQQPSDFVPGSTFIQDQIMLFQQQYNASTTPATVEASLPSQSSAAGVTNNVTPTNIINVNTDATTTTNLDSASI